MKQLLVFFENRIRISELEGIETLDFMVARLYPVWSRSSDPPEQADARWVRCVTSRDGVGSILAGSNPGGVTLFKAGGYHGPGEARDRVSPVEWICRSFAIVIDSLSAALSQTLGPWSQQDLFLQVTPAKLVLGLFSALIILLLLRIVRFLLKRQYLKPR